MEAKGEEKNSRVIEIVKISRTDGKQRNEEEEEEEDELFERHAHVYVRTYKRTYAALAATSS